MGSNSDCLATASAASDLVALRCPKRFRSIFVVTIGAPALSPIWLMQNAPKRKTKQSIMVGAASSNCDHLLPKRRYHTALCPDCSHAGTCGAGRSSSRSIAGILDFTPSAGSRRALRALTTSRGDVETSSSERPEGARDVMTMTMFRAHRRLAFTRFVRSQHRSASSAGSTWS